jgi:kumamolisin
LGCGGTSLLAAGNAISSETVWNDGNGAATGGGISDTFDLPSWQANAGVPPSANPGGRIGRGVPDVAGDADPQTGYLIQVDGQSVVVGGTSAVAPLWAGLIALLNAQLGKPVGYLNPVLYQQLTPAAVLRDVTSGTNDGYSAAPGWDACTGLGSPNGAALLSALAALQGSSASGAVLQAASTPVEVGNGYGAPVTQGASSPDAVAASAAGASGIATADQAPQPEPQPARGGVAILIRALFRRGGQSSRRRV